jgi:ACS family allantoate permease-like MFS transporter
MLFMSYSIGQIIAPHFFLASESPSYPTGFRAFYICVALMIAIEFGMMFVKLMVASAYYYLQNRKRDANAITGQVEATNAVSYDFLDLTDKEHVGFRYVF